MDRNSKRPAWHGHVLIPVSCLCLIALLIRTAPAQPVGADHTITLPTVPIAMPEGPGFKTFNERCVACHSPQYVLNQPRFSREVWTKEVDKMKKTFGAPIADDQVEDIVNYLVSVRGNGK